MILPSIPSKESRWMFERANFAARLAQNRTFQETNRAIFRASRREGMGYYEASGGLEMFAIHRVYTPCDFKFLSRVLQLAETRWPSKHSVHHCAACWLASPCLAIRAWWEGDEQPSTAPFYIQTGCGEVRPVLMSLEEKLHFVRCHGIDAFIAWVDRA